MKNILMIAIMVILLPIKLFANIPDDIKYAIRKSKIDLLKKALDGQTLTDEQKNECSKFANQISNIRESKMNISMFKPQKRVDPSGPFYRVLGILGVGLSIGGFIFLLNRMMIAQNMGAVTADLACMGIFEWATISISKRLLEYGAKLNQKYYEEHRSSKQKYLDSLEIKSILNT